MTDALKRLAAFAIRLARDETVGSARREGYMPRGIRRLEQTKHPGVERAIEMLLKKIKTSPSKANYPWRFGMIHPRRHHWPESRTTGSPWWRVAWSAGVTRIDSRPTAILTGKNTTLPSLKSLSRESGRRCMGDITSSTESEPALWSSSGRAASVGNRGSDRFRQVIPGLLCYSWQSGFAGGKATGGPGDCVGLEKGSR
jgi:hypothetical protein